MAKLEGWKEHNQHILNQLKAGKDDAFLLQQSMEDARNGFLHTPSAASRVPQVHWQPGTPPYPALCHHPKFGKQRAIDNGDTGGQSDLSSDANKLTLCSPVRPAQHISLVMHRWSEGQVAEFCHHDAWETGQEDLPSAYRYCPMSRQESLDCVASGFTMNGKLRHTRSMQAFCLGPTGSHFLQQIFQTV